MKKMISASLAVLIICSTLLAGGLPLGQLSAAATDTNGVGESEIILHVLSPLVMSDGKITSLDSQNPNVVPYVENERTLVPLRAISEHFGAVVSYDENKNEVKIVYSGKTAVFKIGEKSFTFDGKKYALETAAQIVEDRVMVPLRAIAENVLLKTVSYYDDVIVIGDNTVDLSSDKTKFASINEKIGSALKPESFEALKQILSLNENNGYRPVMATGEKSLSQNTPSNDSPTVADGKGSASNGSNSDYTSTNIQVNGIDEGDIVKTDGKYIYVMNSQGVEIIKADQGSMEKTASIKAPDKCSLSEMYIDNNRLVVIGSFYDNDGIRPMINEKVSIMPYYNSKSYVYTGVYDLSDITHPKLIKEFKVEGSLSQSRKNGDIVYIIATKYLWYTNIENARQEDILPLVYDSTKGSETTPLSVRDVMICPVPDISSFTTVAAIDISDATSAANVESFLSNCNAIYMNDSSLYIAQNNWKYDKQTTCIIALNVDGQKIGFRASADIDGYLINQYSMDENEGYFRVAATTNNGNNIYVLSSEMNIVGSIENIAKGERIYAVRFMGNAGYIVTYKSIDPLFVIDLSDPKNPQVTGEVKVPGFSNYLYPLGNGLMFGIGMNTEDMYIKDKNGDEVNIGTRQGGIKLSLFDVSDAKNPKEVDSYILGGAGSYTEVTYNPRALMADSENGVFGFDASVYNYADGKSFSGAVLFNVDKDISLKGKIAYQSYSGGDQDYMYYARRLCRIGNELYYIQDMQIFSYDFSTLKSISSIVLK